MKEKYIQLPPIPADIEIAAIEMIWIFATLDQKGQKEALEYIKSMDAYYEESDTQTFKEFMQKYEENESTEVFRDYIDIVKRLVGRVIMDSYGMAALIYQKRCVEKLSVDEISEECGIPTHKIQLFVDYFDARNNLNLEK